MIKLRPINYKHFKGEIMRAIQKVVVNLNRVATIKNEHMRLVGYEKSKDSEFYLFRPADNSDFLKTVRFTDDPYCRYPAVQYVPFVTNSQVNRFLAYNGAPVVKAPVVIKDLSGLSEREKEIAIYEKCVGRNIQVYTVDGFENGKLNAMSVSESGMLKLFMENVKREEVIVKDPILPVKFLT